MFPRKNLNLIQACTSCVIFTEIPPPLCISWFVKHGINNVVTSRFPLARFCYFARGATPLDNRPFSFTAVGVLRPSARRSSMEVTGTDKAQAPTQPPAVSPRTTPAGLPTRGKSAQGNEGEAEKAPSTAVGLNLPIARPRQKNRKQMRRKAGCPRERQPMKLLPGKS